MADEEAAAAEMKVEEETAGTKEKAEEEGIVASKDAFAKKGSEVDVVPMNELQEKVAAAAAAKKKAMDDAAAAAAAKRKAKEAEAINRGKSSEDRVSGDHSTQRLRDEEKQRRIEAAIRSTEEKIHEEEKVRLERSAEQRRLEEDRNFASKFKHDQLTLIDLTCLTASPSGEMIECSDAELQLMAQSWNRALTSHGFALIR